MIPGALIVLAERPLIAARLARLFSDRGGTRRGMRPGEHGRLQL